MSAVYADKTRPAEAVTEEPRQIRTATLDEILQETELAEKAERALLDSLAKNPNGAAIFDQRTKLIESCYLSAIRRTRPQDWVITKDRQENVTAMLCASGAALVAEVYGIEVENMRPLEKGNFKPERAQLPNGQFELRGWCDAYSRVNGRKVYSLSGARRSDEDFTGRSVDGKGNLTVKSDERAGANPSDLASATYTLLLTKAVRVLCSMTRVPVSDLEKAWDGTGKKVEQCRAGHGFGSSSGRAASAVAEGDVAAEVAKLKVEVLRMAGGDSSAVKKITKEITSGPNFAGFDTLDRVTKGFQVTQAWTNLKKHPLYGPPANGASREPGEDG